MKKEDFRFIGKKELITLLLEEEEKNEKLEKKMLEMEESLRMYKDTAEARYGTIVEARLQMSSLFSSAQKTADMYVENTKKEAEANVEQSRQALEKTMERCRRMEEACQKECAELLETYRRHYAVQGQPEDDK